MTERTDQSTRLRGNRCLCSGCGHIFGSVSAFDRHQSDGGDPHPCLPVEVFAAERPDGKPPRLVWHPSRHVWVTRLDDRYRGTA